MFPRFQFQLDLPQPVSNAQCASKSAVVASLGILPNSSDQARRNALAKAFTEHGVRSAGKSSVVSGSGSCSQDSAGFNARHLLRDAPLGRAGKAHPRQANREGRASDYDADIRRQHSKVPMSLRSKTNESFYTPPSRVTTSTGTTCEILLPAGFDVSEIQIREISARCDLVRLRHMSAKREFLSCVDRSLEKSGEYEVSNADSIDIIT